MKARLHYQAMLYLAMKMLPNCSVPESRVRTEALQLKTTLSGSHQLPNLLNHQVQCSFSNGSLESKTALAKGHRLSPFVSHSDIRSLIIWFFCFVLFSDRVSV